ncbi:MAG: cyclic nucleotide-binding domain-containing protein, partial [Elusimicrobia bacterium]|nr:cyclic nucleotide-binding domain-containing protein [Elusimicrobiota bacterium]
MVSTPSHSIEDSASFLRRVSIFSDLEEETLRKVAARLQTLSIDKGQTLYREGDTGDALYVIQSGRVRVIGRGEDGKEKALNFLGRGETFGETALLTGAPRSVTVRADSNVQLLVLYKQDFETFLRSNPTAAF